MRTITFKFEIQGDSHDELVEVADYEISRYLGFVVDDEDFALDITEEPVDHNINYEMFIKKSEEGPRYSAEIIGRFKDE